MNDDFQRGKLDGLRHAEEIADWVVRETGSHKPCCEHARALSVVRARLESARWTFSKSNGDARPGTVGESVWDHLSSIRNAIGLLAHRVDKVTERVDGLVDTLVHSEGRPALADGGERKS